MDTVETWNVSAVPMFGSDGSFGERALFFASTVVQLHRSIPFSLDSCGSGPAVGSRQNGLDRSGFRLRFGFGTIIRPRLQQPDLGTK